MNDTPPHPAPRRRRAPVLAAIALVAAGLSCAAPGPDRSSDSAMSPRSVPPPPREPDPPAEPLPFAAAIRDARDLLDAREFALAAERLETALRSNPPAQIRPSLLALLKEARAGALASTWLAIEATTERGTVTIGDAVPVRVRIRNRRDEPLVVPMDAASAGDSLPPGVELSRTRLDLRVAYREIDHLGSIVDAEWEAVVLPDASLELAPRAAATVDWSLDTAEARFRPARLVYRQVTIFGTFRPVAILSPGGGTFAPIEFGPLRIDVLPVAYHRLLDDPAARLDESLRQAAVDARYLPHVLFGALFLARVDPAKCARALDRAAKEAGPDLLPTIDGCRALLRRGEFDAAPAPPGDGSSGRADRPDERESPG